MDIGSSMSIALNPPPPLGGAGAPFYSAAFNGALPSGLTFSRADASTCASYYNSAGVLSLAAANTPRFDYNPSTLALNGLLIEQSSTNLIPYSNTFSSWASVTGAGSSITPTYNYAVSPDGTSNAARLQYVNANFAIFQTVGATVTNAATYTFSVWLKSNTGSNQSIVLAANGATGTNAVTVTPLWQRFSVTLSTTSTTLYAQVNAGSASADISIYGGQLENLPFATSYIPTTSSPVTRAMDSVTTTSIPWFAAANGTFITETLENAAAPASTTYRAVAAFTDGTGANRIEMFSGFTGSQVSEGFLSVSSSAFSSATGTVNPGAVNKYGVIYKAASNVCATNGTLNGAGAFNAAAIPSGITTLSLGSTNGTSDPLNGWLRRFAYYNTALSNAQLQQLTT